MQPPTAPKAVFNEAIGLINAGELGAAEARCREALGRYPRDINMQALLGALLVKMDRRDGSGGDAARGRRGRPVFREACRGPGLPAAPVRPPRGRAAIP